MWGSCEHHINEGVNKLPQMQIYCWGHTSVIRDVYCHVSRKPRVHVGRVGVGSGHSELWSSKDILCESGELEVSALRE
jgi:hypothetical protein